MQTGYNFLARNCPLRKARRIVFMVAFSTFVLILITSLRKREDDKFPAKRDFNFSLMLPFIEPKLSSKQRNVFMAVIVNSAAEGLEHKQLRSAIRNTWGRPILFENKSWRLVFALGLTNVSQCNQANLVEAEQFNDVLVGNFTDHYYNIATKTFMGHYWVLSRLSCRYVLKTDDDVYVRIPQTIQWLQNQHFPRPFYGGHVETEHLMVNRGKTDKWYLPRDEYKEDLWPPFCHGAFHIISNDALPLLINWSRKRSPAFTDDAYIAVIMLNASIEATQIPGYSVRYDNVHDCSLDKMNAIGHHFTASAITNLHNFYHDSVWRRKCSFWIYRNVISKIFPVVST